MPKELELTAGSIERDAVASYYLSLDNQNRINLKKKLEKKKVSFYDNYWEMYKNSINFFRKNPDKLEINENNFNINKDAILNKYKSLSDLGKQYVDNIINYGFSQWYDWSCEIWGTKWNVYNEVNVVDYPEKNECEIIFYTAWSVPYGIVNEYSKLCSDDEFHWEYEDEDYDGYHILSKKDGKIISEIIDGKHFSNEDISI